MNDFSRSHHRNDRDAAPNPKGNERTSERSEARDERENERIMNGDRALAKKLKDGVQDLEKELNEANSKLKSAKNTVAFVAMKLKNFLLSGENLHAIPPSNSYFPSDLQRAIANAKLTRAAAAEKLFEQKLERANEREIMDVHARLFPEVVID